LILSSLSIVLLGLFVFLEKHASNPLISFSIFRNKSVTGGNLAMFLIGGATTGLFFALSVYMQQVLHYDALKAGLTQLPLAGALVAVAGVVPAVMKAMRTRNTLAASLILLAAGLFWLSFSPSDASFIADLLGPSIVIGIGLGGAFVSGTELAVHGVTDREAGLASGLINTSQQIGGAIGLAVLTTVASSRINILQGRGKAEVQALTEGFSWVFLGSAVLAIVGAIVVFIIVKRLPSSKDSD
jgi:MFS family permease